MSVDPSHVPPLSNPNSEGGSVPAPGPEGPPGALPAESAPRRRLGEVLLESGLLDARQLKIALDEQRQVKRPLGEILVSLGFLRREVIGKYLAEDIGIPFVRFRDVDPDPLLVSGLDADFVRSLGAFPIRQVEGRLQVAMVDPADPLKVSALRRHFVCELDLSMIIESDLLLLIRKFFPEESGQVSELIDRERELGLDEAEDLPIERITQTLIVDGIRAGVTDIHLHPEENITRIRTRVDGVMGQADVLPHAATAAVVSRIKIMSGLDISERRRPQDGRLRVNVDGRKVDMRVSILPTSYGESVVLRVLDRAAGNIPLAELGISRNSCDLLRRVVERPHGLFLVTGPTGSGKTTTLYSLLAGIDTVHRNVATIEDPVEYNLPFVRQSQVEPSVGFDFQVGLRSLLRQDPDVILVGEVRDSETAGMAIKASMTGHLVLSTLHTNTAIGAVPRLFDLGVSPYLVEDALIGVLAQRLVRRNCTNCLAEIKTTPYERAWLGQEVPYLMRGTGCARCDDTGYSGRTVISELFLPTDELAPLLREGASLPVLGAAARESGFVDMVEEGRRKVLAGLTTADEVERVHKSHRLSEAERKTI